MIIFDAKSTYLLTYLLWDLVIIYKIIFFIYLQGCHRILKAFSSLDCKYFSAWVVFTIFKFGSCIVKYNRIRLFILFFVAYTLFVNDTFQIFSNIGTFYLLVLVNDIF